MGEKCHTPAGFAGPDLGGKGKDTNFQEVPVLS
jgi:hypothetical protein